MFQKRGLQRSLLAVTAATLIGCGGGSDEPNTSDSSGTSGDNSAGAGLAALAPDYIFRDVYPTPDGNAEPTAFTRQPLTVDLGANLSTLPIPGRTLDEIDAERANYRITKITPVGSNCHNAVIADIAGKTFTFQADQYGMCQFDVTFDRNGQVSTERLVVNYGAEPVAATPMIALTVAPDAMEYVDLASDPATQALIAAGYGLQPDSLLRFGAIASAVATANTLTVTAGSKGGAGRVLFTLAKTDDSGAVTDARSGILQVTVSSGDTAPVIALADFETTANSVSDIVTIDLVAEGIVTDADNQAELQIIHLNANRGGTVVLGDSTGAPATEDDYFHNSKFTFTSDKLGVYPVNYVVSDHNGGYASGTLKINVGRLTSPNSPLTATPGRMVEWTRVGEPPNQLVVNRPVLLSEVRTELDGVPDDDITSQDGEVWAYIVRNNGRDFCATFGMKLITATGFEALRQKYASYPNGFMSVLGWQVANRPKEDLWYLIQKTDREETKNHFAIDSLTGNIITEANSNRGMVVCVRSPETVMTYAQPTEPVFAGDGTKDKPWQIEPGGSKQLSVAISNVKGTGTPTCTSSAPGVVSASCSAISNDSSMLTLTAISTGRAVITVRTPDGENLIGNQPPLELYVDNAVSTGVPTLSAYSISEAGAVVVSNEGINDANRMKVRPGDSLTLEWTYVDPDTHQHDATTVEWTNATVTSADQATVDGLGMVTATLTPRSRSLVDGVEEFEVGPPVTLSFAVTNEAPVINSLDITSNDVREGTAFDQSTSIDATHTASDPDDASLQATYVWEQKRPWLENWQPVVDDHSQPVTTKYMPVKAQFFEGRYEGNDLRLRMTVSDDHGGQSAEVAQTVYPVATTPTDTLEIRSVTDKSPLLIHRRPAPYTQGFNRSEVWRWDALCRDGITAGPGSSYTQLRLVRSGVIDMLKDQKHTLRYWHPAYVSDPKIPYATGRPGDQAVYVWDAASGVIAAQPGDGQTSEVMSLVCEEVLLNDLEIYPLIAQTVPGRNLLMHWAGKSSSNDYHSVDPTPASGLHGVTDWTSSNPAVATVDAEGVLTPHAVGTTYISSTFMGDTKTREVTVKESVTPRLCGGKIDDTSVNSYSDCLKVASIETGYLTGPFSKIATNLLALSHDPSGISPHSYQEYLWDKAGLVGEGDNEYAGFQYDKGNGARFREWCNILSGMNFQGRNNWQPATREQLTTLKSRYNGEHGWGLEGLGWVSVRKKMASTEVNEANKTLKGIQGWNGHWSDVPFTESVHVSCFAANPAPAG